MKVGNHPPATGDQSFNKKFRHIFLLNNLRSLNLFDVYVIDPFIDLSFRQSVSFLLYFEQRPAIFYDIWNRFMAHE